MSVPVDGQALKPGALVFHAEYGVAFVRRGNAHGARFVWWVEGPGFDGRPADWHAEQDETWFDGWSLVGDGFAPEGAVLAWVSEDFDTALRHSDEVHPSRADEALLLLRSNYVALNPVQSETP